VIATGVAAPDGKRGALDAASLFGPHIQRWIDNSRVRTMPYQIHEPCSSSALCCALFALRCFVLVHSLPGPDGLQRPRCGCLLNSSAISRSGAGPRSHPHEVSKELRHCCAAGGAVQGVPAAGGGRPRGRPRLLAAQEVWCARLPPTTQLDAICFAVQAHIHTAARWPTLHSSSSSYSSDQPAVTSGLLVLRRNPSRRQRAIIASFSSQTLLVLRLPCRSSTRHRPAGGPAILPLVPAMLAKLEGELGLYQRIVTSWPQFGPALEASMCAALRDTVAATSRQCGLVQVRIPRSPHNSGSTAVPPNRNYVTLHDRRL